jgi:hypothetical protein
MSVSFRKAGILDHAECNFHLTILHSRKAKKCIIRHLFFTLAGWAIGFLEKSKKNKKFWCRTIDRKISEQNNLSPAIPYAHLTSAGVPEDGGTRPLAGRMK